MARDPAHKTRSTCPNIFTPEHWSRYWPVMGGATARGIPFAIGGGMALSCYTRQFRLTKDLDLYILPRDRDAMVGLTADAGFVDYFDRLPYDRAWIYRGIQEDGYILDLIWQMANQRAEVDEGWLTLGPEMRVHGRGFPILPAEELLWAKLFVMQRDRCDWPDLFNLLYAEGVKLDWERLLNRAGEDTPLLGGVLSAFGWLCPQIARQFPDWLWPRVRIELPVEGPNCDEEPRRIRLLDSRPWFGPLPQPAPLRPERSGI